MSIARLSLGLAALLLFATAALHASGATMVSGWLPGQRGAILDVLWIMPVIDWAIIGVLWLFVAWRDERGLAPLVWISAVVPLLVAVHSFAPTLAGNARPWHAGVLWDHDEANAQRLLHRLRAHKGLVIGDNEPYSGSSRLAPSRYTTYTFLRLNTSVIYPNDT